MEEDVVTLQDSLYVELSLVPNENASHNFYQEQGIAERHLMSSEFENGEIIDEYIQSIEYYDSMGYLILAEEFYLGDSLPVCIVKYEYDSRQRMVNEEWNWKDPDSFQRSEYVYSGKLIEMKDLYKDSIDVKYELESKTEVIYRQNRIDLLLSEKNDTVSYFIHGGDYSYQYSAKKVLKTAYRNGLIEKMYEGNKITTFDRDLSGNILKITCFTEDKRNIYTITNEYDGGLLIKTTNRFGDGEIMSIGNYNYVH